MNACTGTASLVAGTTVQTMVSPDESLRLVIDAARLLPPERRPLDESVGLVLAEEVVADRDQPPFDRAMMDGYAVGANAAGAEFTVDAVVAAGYTSSVTLAEGKCIEIMTGAPCPAGTYAVVPKEEVRRHADRVLLPSHIAPGQHIAARGSECPKGAAVLQSGNRIDALTVAVLATFGNTTPQVVRPPQVAVITTGAELVGPEASPAAAQIRDGNGPMLMAMTKASGAVVSSFDRVADSVEAIVGAIQDHASADVLVLSGGVSAGRYDLVPEALQRVGAEVVFHKVRQKPGKPLLLARRGEQLVLALPGNPLACHFCFHRYVAAAIRKMQNRPAWPLRRLGHLTEGIVPRAGRAFFVLGRVEETAGPKALPTIRPLPGRSSADVFAARGADCYIEAPPGKAIIPAGTLLPFTRIEGT